MILEQRGPLRVLRLEDADEALRYRAGFVGAYQTVFSGPPYNERFFPSEAASVLRRAVETPDHIVLVVVKGRSSVVAFGIGVPLSSRPDVSRSMQGLVPAEHSFYLAELGVLNQYRSQGLGKMLVEHRLRLIDRQKYSHVLLRTSLRRDGAMSIYEELGFEDMGVYMEVASRRTDGSVRTDRRLFLSRVLASEAAEEPISVSPTDG